MRKPLLVTVLSAALAGPALLAAGPASAASFVPCAGSYGPDGTPGQGFYSQIRAKRVSCTTAKRITRAWVKSHADGADNPTTKVRILGYSCSGRAKKLAPGDREGGLAVLCVSGIKAVSFYGHP